MEEWEKQAIHMIAKSDGKKNPKEAIIDAVTQLIEEHLNMFGHQYGISAPSCDPQEGITYASLRFKKALERFENAATIPNWK